MDALLPTWYALMALAALTFILRHKWAFVQQCIGAFSPALMECPFCLGFIVGGLYGFIRAAFSDLPPTGPAMLIALAVSLVWSLCGAAASLTLDRIAGEG